MIVNKVEHDTVEDYGILLVEIVVILYTVSKYHTISLYLA